MKIMKLKICLNINFCNFIMNYDYLSIQNHEIS